MFFVEGLHISDKNAVFTSYYLGNEYRINLEGNQLRRRHSRSCLPYNKEEIRCHQNVACLLLNR